MKYKTVSALCEGIAEAIKEKEGSSEKINPQDFADRIKGLEVGGASGSKMRYFKVVRALPSAGGGDQAVYSQLSQLTRCEDNGKVFINSGCYDTQLRGKSVVAYGVDLSVRVNPSFDGEEFMTLEEALAGMYDDPSYFEEITEAEFYDLNTLLTPQEITFTVSGVEYTALSGMTWEEFCNSDYNIGGQDWMSDDLRFECDGNTIYAYKGELSSGRVENASPTDTIIANTAYSIRN